MSKNSIHQTLPPNKQLSAQTYGDVNYKITIDDVDDNQQVISNRVVLNELVPVALKGGGSGGKINGNITHTDTYAKIIDIISEGEIEGAVNGLQSVIFNGTPLADTNNVLNFKGVQVYPMSGTPDQEPPAMFTKSGTTQNVNFELKNGVSHQYTLTISDDTTSVNVIVSLPELSSTDSKGNINGTSVLVEFSVNGYIITTKRISGIATSEIEVGVVINLMPYTGSKIVRVRRITANPDNIKILSSTFISSITKFIDHRLNYADCAGVCYTLDAKLFGSQLPDRAIDCKGINTIKIPINYNPITREYTGVWNGVFKTAYTDNPIWCFYDLLTNTRYGAGDYVDENFIDKYELYSLAQYCDDEVSALDGTKEPRFTFNAYITEREQFLSIVKKMQGSFLASIFYFGGIISFAQDKPIDPVAVVTNANVLNGKFTYSSTELDEQTNVAVVSYNDPDNKYALTTETVYNNELFNQSGIEVKKEINAFGCTSRSQAHRLGKYQLLSDALNSETVTYTTGLDHSRIIVGDVIRIFDNDMSSNSVGGRILSMLGDTIKLDRKVTLTPSTEYQINILDISGRVQVMDISPASIGNISEINVIDADGFSANNFSIFGINKKNDVTKSVLYRVLTIRENDLNKYDIVANKYDLSKYDILYSSNPVDVIPETPLPPVQVPRNIYKSGQSLVKDGKNVLNNVSFSWDKEIGVTHYEYQYRLNSNEFSQIKRTDFNEVSIIDGNGTYDFRVRALNLLNNYSAFGEDKLAVSTGDVIPSDVSHFNIHRSGVALIFTWQEIILQEFGVVAYYEIRLGDTWATGLTVFKTLSNSYTYTLNTGGNFLIKAVTIAGVESLHATSQVAITGDTNIYITKNYGALGYPIKDPQQIQNFIIEREEFTFSDGEEFTFSDGDVFSFTSPDEDRLKLIGENYKEWQELTDPWTTYTKRWVADVFIGDKGIYETDVEDLGVVVDVFIHAIAKKSVNKQPLYAPDFKDLYVPDLVNGWYATGIEEASTLNIEVQFSNDGVTFSEYTPFIAGQYRARYFRYKLILEALVMKYNLYVDSFKVEYDIPDVEERAIITTESDGKFTYTYSKTFHTDLLSVVCTPNNRNSNVTVKLISKDKTEVTFESTDQTTGLFAPNIEVNVVVIGY